MNFFLLSLQMKLTQTAIIIALFATLSFSAEKKNNSIFGGMIDAFFERNTEFVFGGRLGFDITGRGVSSGIMMGISFLDHIIIVPDVDFTYIPKVDLNIAFNVPLLIQVWFFNLEGGLAANRKIIYSGEPDKQYEYGPMLGLGYNFSKNSSINVRGFYDVDGNENIRNIFNKNSIIRIELNCRYLFFNRDLDDYDKKTGDAAKATKKAVLKN